jgi:hypothetical protein
MDCQPLAKRSACDRCRAKRARCPRTEDTPGPCARCVRAGAECVTGQPGRLGRPRKAFANPNSRLSGPDRLRGSQGAQPSQRGVQAPAQNQLTPISPTVSSGVDSPAPGSAGGKDAGLFCGDHSADLASGAFGSSHPTGSAPWEVPDLFHDFLDGNASRGSFSPFLDFEPIVGKTGHGPFVDSAPECPSGGKSPGIGNLDGLFADDSRRPMALVHVGPGPNSFRPLTIRSPWSCQL